MPAELASARRFFVRPRTRQFTWPTSKLAVFSGICRLQQGEKSRATPQQANLSWLTSRSAIDDAPEISLNAV